MGEKLNLNTIAKRYSDEESAWLFLESKRWANGRVCPHCGTVDKAYFLKPQNGARKTKRGNVSYRRLWKCAACRKPFSVLVGTIFEDTHIPLSKWLLAIHLLCSSKNGTASYELHRTLGVARKTAWHLTHRIREIFSQPAHSEKLGGIIEVDETYIGGKAENMHRAKRERVIQGRGTVGKTPVLSITERGGEARSQVVSDVNGKTVQKPIAQNIDPQAVLNTDASPVYNQVGKEFARHETVDHGAGEYVRGDVHINTVEGYFGQLKPSIRGTYRHVSAKHLNRYLGEFDFRYSNRKIEDGERTLLAIQKARGKRLTYHALTGKTK